MIPRTYRAPTMPKALAKVKADLGLDALVISARKVLGGPAWQVWREPVFEIVALPPTTGGNGSVSSATLPIEKPDSTARLAQDIAALREALAQMVRQIDPVQAHWPDAVTAVYRRLIAQEVDADLAGEIASKAMETLSPRALGDSARVREHFVQDLNSRISTSDLTLPTQRPLVVALVGPSGSGKTLAAAKLAGFVRFVLQRSAALLTLDTFRIGALPQIQTLAEIMQLPLTVAYTPSELATAIEAQSETDVLLLDTPARNPQRPEEIAELAELMAPLPKSRKLYLVASATAKSADLSRAADAFKSLGINGWLFTHLDETNVYGSMFSLACRTHWPIAYLSSSPHAPDEIEPASADRIISLLLGEAEKELAH